MRAFIEKQHSGSKRAAPAKHQCDPYQRKPEFNVSNNDLSRMARVTEANTNNNNIYNGKNVSDNSKVSNFYALKAHTPYQSPLLYFGQNENKNEAP
jgi:hypothetical protein